MPPSILFALPLIVAATFVPAYDTQAGLPADDLPRPTPVQLAWQRAELGVVYHYDLHVFDDGHYVQSKNRRTPPGDTNRFAPTELDVGLWVRTARAMGARFAILTASHETGFRLWQSDVNPYCLRAVEWGGGERDLVAEFVRECRAQDIAPGIYLGTRWNAQLGVLDFRVTERSPVTQAEYNALIEAEVEEICSRYGPLFELWFDGGAFGPDLGGPDVLSVVERLQPDCGFYHNHDRADARWGGSESGTVPYPCWATLPFQGYVRFNEELARDGFRLLRTGDPDGDVWCPAMSDAPVRNHEWFWDEGDDDKVRDASELVDMYYRSVGHNSTLILGLTPDDRGLMPRRDVEGCEAVGAAIADAFARPAGHGAGTGDEVVLRLDGPRAIDHIVVQETIAEGERVRAYEIDVREDGAWRTLATGTCIGHKRIHRFDRRTVDAVRLRVLAARAEPRIERLEAVRAGD